MGKEREGRLATESACAIGSAMVGAGFASGREIATFFAEYGVYGYIGAAIAAWIMGGVSSRLMRLCGRYGASGLPELADKLAGRRCTAVRLLFLLLALTMTAAMLAGAGELWALGVDMYYAREMGVIITAALALMCARLGVRALGGIGAVLLMGVFAYYAVLLCAEPVWELRAPGYGACTMGTIYASMNVAMASGVIAPTGMRLTARQSRSAGRKLSVIMLVLMVLAISVLLTHWETCRSAALPTVMLASDFGYAGFYATLAVMWLAMLTTLTAAQSALRGQCAAWGVGDWRGDAGIFAVSIALGMCGFENVVGIAYPAAGVACALAIAWLLTKGRRAPSPVIIP